MPNMVYMIEGNGTVAYRARRNDPGQVEKVLQSLAAGHTPIAGPPPGFPVGPRGGCPIEGLHERVLGRAAAQAITDMQRALPCSGPASRYRLRPCR